MARSMGRLAQRMFTTEARSGVIDLRSDTVTRACSGMKAAMANAEVGDDVFRDDPSVLRLEKHLANLFGYEAGLYCTSGTQSNLVLGNYGALSKRR